jgi:transglutaminase-like putative cysteine protease
MKAYLESSEMIDWKHASITRQAAILSAGSGRKVETANACFEFVRDQIKHSWDFQMNPVTCAASDVLKHGTGYCYAKSHLLAALLRANGIPAGLSYQRLTISDDVPPFSLHGLNAVWLEGHGWYRIDARGNKSGVDAQFCPPVEKLAFPIITEGEADLPGIYAEPLPVVVQALCENKTWQDVADHLPEIEPNQFVS